MPKAKSKRRRYTAAEKQHILAVAKKEGLSGPQVKKRFGISLLTFYGWRGPVRGKRASGRGASRAAVTNTDPKAVRIQVRTWVRGILPRMIREEVAAGLRELIGGRRERSR